MSGLAEILLNLGFKVSGSDLNLNHACKRLQTLGAKIAQGHSAANLSADSSLLVYSSAVTPENPELIEATKRGIPLVRRAEVLAELMRLKFGVAVAGSHGKTTTTSMIAAVLEAAKLDPTVIIGGQVRSIGSGGKLGKGDFLVAESDESDRSFLLLKPSIAVVTNIDAEHLSAYASIQDLENSFEQFVRGVPFYGLALMCIDDARVRDLAQRYSGRKMTFGLSPDAQLRAVNITQKRNVSSFEVLHDGQTLFNLDLPMPGKHLVSNSLAAVGIGLELGIALETIREALNSFAGVGRRAEVVGEQKGITIISDYAHHPTEVRATLEAVCSGWREKGNRVHVVFQPHRYTRTRECFVEFLSAFSQADTLLLTDIYAASEAPIEGISAATLLEAIAHPNKFLTPQLADVIAHLETCLRSGDVVLFMGAGSIGSYPEMLLERLSA